MRTHDNARENHDNNRIQLYVEDLQSERIQNKYIYANGDKLCKIHVNFCTFPQGTLQAFKGTVQ